LKGILF